MNAQALWLSRHVVRAKRARVTPLGVREASIRRSVAEAQIPATNCIFAAIWPQAEGSHSS